MDRFSLAALPLVVCGLLHGEEQTTYSIVVTPADPAGPAPPVSAPLVGQPAPARMHSIDLPRWDLDLFSGLRFGGVIGASIDNALTYDLHGPIQAELSTDVGVGGTLVGLGPRFSFGSKQWTLSSYGLNVDYQSDTAIVPRLIAAYRWENRRRSPSLWRGIVTDGGWYYGGDCDVLYNSLAFDLQVTWEQRHHEHAPRFTLAYGVGF